MLWMRVWSPAGTAAGCSTAMADRLLPLLFFARALAGEDFRDVVPALLHAHQAEAQVGDDVPDDVGGLLALGGQQQDVAGARQTALGVEDLHPARVERLTHRAGAVRVLVGVGDLDREGRRGLGE